MRVQTIRLRAEAKIGRECRADLGLSGPAGLGLPDIVHWYEDGLGPPPNRRRQGLGGIIRSMFEVPSGPPVTTRTADELERELAAALDSERRADCMARIQSDAVQLALDLVVREKDIDGFFRTFIKTLVEECESRACGVWLLDGDGRCEPWMAFVDGQFHASDAAEWDATALPRQAMAAHLAGYTHGWQQTVEYLPDDSRLPESVRAFNVANGIASVQVAPLKLSTHNLGWIALASNDASACETTWRKAVLEAVARQATLALHQDRLAEQGHVEARRQAALEERNRLARDIHDTLTQGFAAILMQLQG